MKDPYEKPTIRKHTQLLAIAPAGCKLGHAAIPTKGCSDIKPDPGDISGDSLDIKGCGGISTGDGGSAGIIGDGGSVI